MEKFYCGTRIRFGVLCRRFGVSLSRILILGDNDEKSAGKEIIEIALANLQKGKYGVNHNSPFKGGFITRSFGMPENNVHALQLEMTKTNYMNDDELNLMKKEPTK